MRTILTVLFYIAFAYFVIGAGIWWQWHSGAMENSNFASYPDNADTLILVVTRWPTLVI